MENMRQVMNRNNCFCGTAKRTNLYAKFTKSASQIHLACEHSAIIDRLLFSTLKL